jgi:uncharacterized protein (TIGR03083 family)
MTDNELQPLIAATYLALADLLDALPAERWDTPSLCEGWRVREVVAHLTMPARYSEDAFMAELRADEFDFTRLSNRIASRDAKLATVELVGNLRDEALHRWTPPGGGYHGALNHVVIHSLDVTSPLDESRRASDTAMRSVFDDLTAGGGHRACTRLREGRCSLGIRRGRRSIWCSRRPMRAVPGRPGTRVRTSPELSPAWPGSTRSASSPRADGIP